MIDIENFKIFGKSWSICILDFNRGDIALECIKSLQDGVRGEYDILYYSNGGPQQYVIDFYNAGYIDKLFLSSKNEGCNSGTIRLINNITTEYFIFLESDNVLMSLTQKNLTDFEDALNSEGVGCIDLAGLGHLSQRAFAMKTNLYKELKHMKPNGGPGPFEYTKNEWTEGEAQKLLKQKNLHSVAAAGFIKNNGKFTIREMLCGGILKLRCDTKQLWIEKTPKQKQDIFHLSDVEWGQILNKEWIDGTVPKGLEKESFVCFN